MVTVEFNFLPFSYCLSFRTSDAEAYRKIKERVEACFPEGRNYIQSPSFFLSEYGYAWSADDGKAHIQVFLK
jgi:hypothetical protein